MISTRCSWPTLMSSTSAFGSTTKWSVRAMSATRFSAAGSSRKTPLRTGSVPRTMFSATVITGMSMKCWCTMPIPRSIARRGESIVTGSPSTRISPSSGRYRPYRIDMSVDLPAPFSPRSAWTSPACRSKSTPSLATMRPKRFVMPRSSSARSMPSLGRALPHRVGRRDLPVEDLLLDVLDLSGVLLARRADLADADAVVLQAVHGVRAALVGVVLDGLDRVEHRDVHLLEGARDDLRPEIGLVGVDADRLHALLLGRVDRAEAARARDLEDDLRALGDLVERDLLALVLRREALRVAVEGRDARIGLLRAGLEAGDVVVDRRDLLAADAAHRAAVVLGVQARQIPDEVA